MLFRSGVPPAAGVTPIAWPTPIVPDAPGATLRVQSASVTAPDRQGTVCVELAGSDGIVAGTQNELVWDLDCLTITDPCQANPTHGKTVLTGGPYHGRLKTIVFAFDNTDPIEDGVLYCCPFRLASAFASSCCTVRVEDALASDPYGDAIATEAVAGQICLR